MATEVTSAKAARVSRGASDASGGLGTGDSALDENTGGTPVIRRGMRTIARLVGIGVWIVTCCVPAFGDVGEVRVIVRGDDMGVAQAINEACIKAYREGIVRSVEVIVPGAWFLDAVRLAKENPELDVGVHLCLTSEWDYCKWRPLTRGASLVDADGYFYRATKQRGDLPGNSGFLDAKPKVEEVEAELRAQIEMAKKHIPRISHVSVHMYTVRSSPEIEAVARKLAKEYGLKFDDDGMKRAVYWGGTNPEAHAKRLVARLAELGAGTHLIITHPGLNTPELRGFGNNGAWDVAEERAATTEALTSKLVREAVKERGMRVIGYREVGK
jgi:predicted glycoside hydrolase/deacetylase ChbG (UPF0249 family)